MRGITAESWELAVSDTTKAGAKDRPHRHHRLPTYLQSDVLVRNGKFDPDSDYRPGPSNVLLSWNKCQRDVSILPPHSYPPLESSTRGAHPVSAEHVLQHP